LAKNQTHQQLKCIVYRWSFVRRHVKRSKMCWENRQQCKTHESAPHSSQLAYRWFFNGCHPQKKNNKVQIKSPASSRRNLYEVWKGKINNWAHSGRLVNFRLPKQSITFPTTVTSLYSINHARPCHRAIFLLRHRQWCLVILQKQTSKSEKTRSNLATLATALAMLLDVLPTNGDNIIELCKNIFVAHLRERSSSAIASSWQPICADVHFFQKRPSFRRGSATNNCMFFIYTPITEAL